MRNRTFDRFFLFAVVLAVVAGACGDGATSGNITAPAAAVPQLTAISPTALAGTVGVEIAPPPSVRVTRLEGGVPIAHVLVTFEFTGSPSATKRSAYTDSEGVARVEWVLGTVAGTQHVTATSSVTGAAKIVFTATAIPGPVASVSPSKNNAREGGSGDMQSALAGSTLPYPLTLIASDEFGNPVSGLAVTFSVLAGGGSIEGATAVTSSSGEASSGSWTLGPVLGTQHVKASVGTLQTVFTAEACMTVCSATGQLAFVRGRDIHRLLRDGTVIKLTHTGNNYHPAWSPDGLRLAFTRYDGARSDIFVMNADGSNVVRRTVGGDFHSPAWSPDGRTLAVSRGYVYYGDIFLMSAIDDGVAPTWRAGGAILPAWSPDGKQIAYVELSGDDGYDRIGVMNADGSQARAVTPSAGGAGRPTWSPDGKQIAFVDWLAGMSQVYVVNADGTGLKPVTQPGYAWEATWSPDGARIAYTMRAEFGWGGGTVVYISPTGVGPNVLIENASSPAWAP